MIFSFLLFLSFYNMFVSLVFFFALFPSWHSALVLLSSLHLVSFLLIGWYNFWLPLLAGSLSFTFFFWTAVISFVCVYVCVWVCFIVFVIICLILSWPFVCDHLLFLFIFCLFVCLFYSPFNAITNDLWNFGSLTSDWAWAFGVGVLSPGL